MMLNENQFTLFDDLPFRTHGPPDPDPDPMGPGPRGRIRVRPKNVDLASTPHLGMWDSLSLPLPTHADGLYGRDVPEKAKWTDQHPSKFFMSEDWKKAPIREVDFTSGNDALIGQGRVTSAGVGHYLATMDTSRPVLSSWNDKFDPDEHKGVADDGYPVDLVPRAMVSPTGDLQTVNGHHRIAAARIQGWGSMPMRVMDQQQRYKDLTAGGGVQGSLFAQDLETGEPIFSQPFEGHWNRGEQDEAPFGQMPEYGGASGDTVLMRQNPGRRYRYYR